MRIEKIHTSENPSDFVTKPVTVVKFEKCIDLIVVVDLDQRWCRGVSGGASCTLKSSGNDLNTEPRWRFVMIGPVFKWVCQISIITEIT